jgi:hypothetical protein
VNHVRSVWAAHSVDAVRDYIDSTLGDSSDNTYHEPPAAASRHEQAWRLTRKVTAPMDDSPLRLGGRSRIHGNCGTLFAGSRAFRCSFISGGAGKRGRLH